MTQSQSQTKEALRRLGHVELGGEPGSDEERVRAFATAGPVARRAALALASEYDHEWSRLDEHVLLRGNAGQVWQAWRDHLAGKPEGWRWGLAPALDHETGTGRLVWEIDPRTGRVDLCVRRPRGPVLRATVDVAARRVRVVVLDADRTYERHVVALCEAVSALLPEAWEQVFVGTVDQVSRPAYWRDALADTDDDAVDDGCDPETLGPRVEHWRRRAS